MGILERGDSEIPGSKKFSSVLGSHSCSSSPTPHLSLNCFAIFLSLKALTPLPLLPGAFSYWKPVGAMSSFTIPSLSPPAHPPCSQLVQPWWGGEELGCGLPHWMPRSFPWQWGLCRYVVATQAETSVCYLLRYKTGRSLLTAGCWPVQLTAALVACSGLIFKMVLLPIY